MGVCVPGISILSCGEVMNAPVWRAELTSALDDCKQGTEFLFINLFFLSFSLARVVVLQNGVHSPKEEVSLNKKETCHQATSASGTCLAHYSEIRFCSHTSGDFYFHWHAGVKPVFGLQRLLSYIDPVSSFCPLPPPLSHPVCVTRPLDELWEGATLALPSLRTWTKHGRSSLSQTIKWKWRDALSRNWNKSSCWRH